MLYFKIHLWSFLVGTSSSNFSCIVSCISIIFWWKKCSSEPWVSSWLILFWSDIKFRSLYQIHMILDITFCGGVISRLLSISLMFVVKLKEHITIYRSYSSENLAFISALWSYSPLKFLPCMEALSSLEILKIPDK